MTENEYGTRQVPKDESGRMELLATRPDLWEYLLFGNVLYTARAAHETRWRDYELGYTLDVGPVIQAKQIPDALSERLSHATAITGNLTRILTPAAQERAFGKPGEPGDSILIEHMAKRLIDVYSQLLGWAEQTRALRVPDWAERLKELLAAFVGQPLQSTHDFVDDYIANLEQAIADLAAGRSEGKRIEMTLTFTLDDDLLEEYNKEFERVKRHVRRAGR